MNERSKEIWRKLNEKKMLDCLFVVVVVVSKRGLIWLRFSSSWLVWVVYGHHTLGSSVVQVEDPLVYQLVISNSFQWRYDTGNDNGRAKNLWKIDKQTNKHKLNLITQPTIDHAEILKFI